MSWLIYPKEKTVFIYPPKQEIEVFDNRDSLIPVPSSASEIQITIKDLFAFLLK